MDDNMEHFAWMLSNIDNDHLRAAVMYTEMLNGITTIGRSSIRSLKKLNGTEPTDKFFLWMASWFSCSLMSLEHPVGMDGYVKFTSGFAKNPVFMSLMAGLAFWKAAKSVRICRMGGELTPQDIYLIRGTRKLSRLYYEHIYQPQYNEMVKVINKEVNR